MEEDRKKVKKIRIELIVYGLAVLMLLFSIFFRLNFRIYKNSTLSMYPTIDVGDYSIATFNFKEINRGDMIAFKDPFGSGDNYIKRVIGLPNETIEIKDHELYISGEKYDDIFKSSEIPETYYEIVLESDEYFVMGDNRSISLDSRDFGPIKYQDIIAKVIRVVKSPVD